MDPFVLRGLGTAIIDEADSVLLDEAATPLILSGGAESAEFTAAASKAYVVARRMAKSLEEGRDFVIDRQQRSVELTEGGFRMVHDLLKDHGPLELLQPWQLATVWY